MKLDRLVGGLCLSIGATRLLLGMPNPMNINWVFLGIGILAIVLCIAEHLHPKWFAPPTEDEIRGLYKRYGKEYPHDR